MPMIRPHPRDIDKDDRDLWCIIIDGEECGPDDAQCPSCGHMPKDRMHVWEPDERWTCASCGYRKPVVPYSIEVP